MITLRPVAGVMKPGGRSLLIDARIEALYRSHAHAVYRRCRALLGDDDEAYDALQEVFVKVLDSRPSLDHDRPILHWLNRVTTNHCFNRLRARKYRRHCQLDELRGVADTSPLQFMTHLSEQRNLVTWLLLYTDERTRNVVISYFFDETPVEAIGKALGISVPTVRRVLKHFLERSKTKLTRAEDRLSGRKGSEAEL
jgi:RNA polymerase sigma-70 factor (ECF subfamily)